MKRRIAFTIITCSAVIFSALPSFALKKVAKDPYVGAIVMDCTTGRVIFEDHADAPAYPASTVKLMDLLVLLEMVEQGKATLSDRIKVTKESYKIGGTQVWLDPRESGKFMLDDMLYALMIRSANDVAVALAIHYAGSKDAFVKLMNERAKELGMKDTVFNSVHGLPPDPKLKQKPDITTARDMARLGMEVVKHKRAFKYTATVEKWFRDNTFQMLNHNHLLGAVDGCDGLKTGYISAGGSSIVATVERDGRRIVAVVLGSSSSKKRDAVAKEIIADAFLNLPDPAAVVKPPVNLAAPAGEKPEKKVAPSKGESGLVLSRTFLVRAGLVAAVVLVLLAVSRRAMKKKFDKYEFY